MRTFNWIAALLLFIGGINWGLVGIFDFNVIAYLFEHIYLDRILYVAIGVSAVYFLFAWPILMKKR